MSDPTGVPDNSSTITLAGADHPAPAGVCIYNINRGEVKSVFSSSMAILLHQDAIGSRLVRGYLQRAGTASPSIVRSAGVEHFLNETDGEWMHWADSDIEFTPDALDLQMEVMDPVTAPIVCGLYCSALPDGLVGLAWHLDGTIFSAEELRTEIDKGTRLIEVSKTGAGWLTIHRDALMKMHANRPEDPWFGEDIVDGVKQGEDFTFCHRARAVGLTVHVDLGANLQHHKEIALHKGMLGNVFMESREAGATATGATAHHPTTLDPTPKEDESP